MPDMDGGHGFLTALLPLNTEPCRRLDGTITSPAHAVRELLGSLPTARHSPACAEAPPCPFARSLSTHFIRFAVIDELAFNGRDPQDAIRTAALGPLNLTPDLLTPSRADRLAGPVLLFCADFDLNPDARQRSLRTYLGQLCAETLEVWRALLTHCEGFKHSEDASPDACADYVAACCVETTMPFNDYAVASARPVGLPPLLTPLALAALAGAMVAGAVLLVLPSSWGLWRVVAALAGFAATGVAAALALVPRFGMASTPWASSTDLRTVLKSLHLQAAFARFALAQQGASPQALKAAFQDFLAREKPGDLDGPTQAPGIVP